MNAGFPKRKGIRLQAEAYRQLHRAILRRDGWRCQSCGRAQNLEVHHLHSRGHLGEDTEENLVTLCVNCHRAAHRALQPVKGGCRVSQNPQYGCQRADEVVYADRPATPPGRPI